MQAFDFAEELGRERFFEGMKGGFEVRHVGRAYHDTVHAFSRCEKPISQIHERNAEFVGQTSELVPTLSLIHISEPTRPY